MRARTRKPYGSPKAVGMAVSGGGGVRVMVSGVTCQLPYERLRARKPRLLPSSRVRVQASPAAAGAGTGLMISS